MYVYMHVHVHVHVEIAIKRHLGAKNSGTGSRVVSPDFSTDLESPAQELSGKIVRSHSRQLEAPVWENCPFVGWPGK